MTVQPTAAVAVCAYTEDRWEHIVAGLTAVAEQSRPADEVVLVIDHNPALLSRARAELGERATIVSNAHTPGASGARNTAVELLQCDVVVFLDDDAAPEPDWLHHLLAPYADESVMAVGGRAVPQWPTARPAQLAPELDWIVGCTYEGQPTEPAEVRNLWGCNMSVRREVFDEVGGFDESAGRIGKIPLGCEETELCIRISQRLPGARIIFEPAAVVRHHVTPERTTWGYLRRRSLAEGISKAAISRLVGAADATSSEWTYTTRVLPAGVRRELARGVRGDGDGFRAAAGIVSSLGLASWGYLRGRLGQRSGIDDEAARARQPRG